MRSSPHNFKDIAGKRYGKWYVLERVPNRYRSIYYLCRCDCGTVAQVGKKQLEHNKSFSCGCIKRTKKGSIVRLNPRWGKRWSKADEFLVRQWYPKTGTKKLVGFLGRSREAIRHKAYILGLECELETEEYFFRPDQWSEEELAILKEHYPSGGSATCIKLLPHRTKNAIWVKAQKEGLLLERNAA